MNGRVRYEIAGCAALILHALIICGGALSGEGRGIADPSLTNGKVLSVHLRLSFPARERPGAVKPVINIRPQAPLAGSRVLNGAPHPEREQGIPGLGSGRENGDVLYLKPRPEKEIQPVYPLGARLREDEGIVTLRVFVSAAGVVDRVTVEGSSGLDSLDRAALTAVRHSSFRPAFFRGEPVAGQVVVRINFQMHDKNR